MELLSWFGDWFRVKICFLLGGDNIPVPVVGAGFSAFFGLDFVCKKTTNPRRTPMINYYPTVIKSTNKIQN